MPSPKTVVPLLWGVWLLAWVVASAFTNRTAVRQSAGSRLAYLVLWMGGSLLLFFRPSALGPIPLPFALAFATSWVGVALVAVGLAFAGWARLHLGRLWSGSVTLKADHTIVRTGPYALARHPIYTGIVAATLGTALVRGTMAGFLGLLLLTLGVVVKLRLEERLLRTHFGDAYAAYQEEVATLIPGVW